ncbi:hypothetical protein HAX54_042864, partial [Datura stramonium]|nr:hypothetical protein [Datura stramonium]
NLDCSRSYRLRRLKLALLSKSKVYIMPVAEKSPSCVFYPADIAPGSTCNWTKKKKGKRKKEKRRKGLGLRREPCSPAMSIPSDMPYPASAAWSSASAIHRSPAVKLQKTKEEWKRVGRKTLTTMKMRKYCVETGEFKTAAVNSPTQMRNLWKENDS